MEDEALVAEALAHVLHFAGFRVVGIAHDEASALRKAAEGLPDLVLMDIRLAGSSDGIEAARKMQAERALEVVFMTAFHDPQTRARAAEVRPAGFIQKPFSYGEIVDAVSIAGARRRNR
ncbi:MAG: hypothetical protein K0S81_1014 [Rhodospirillales bacterium]|nr:hypothetical protein [Rhodospirillales bacterium]